MKLLCQFYRSLLHKLHKQTIIPQFEKLEKHAVHFHYTLFVVRLWKEMVVIMKISLKCFPNLQKLKSISLDSFFSLRLNFERLPSTNFMWFMKIFRNLEINADKPIVSYQTRKRPSIELNLMIVESICFADTSSCYINRTIKASRAYCVMTRWSVICNLLSNFEKK